MNKIFDSKQPMGMPQGTVRASLAILVVMTICIMNIKDMNIDKEFYMILGTMVGFYFGSRK